jgi:very-short-patch-repair endonuclease
MRRAQPWRTNRARALRSKSSAAEDILWANLRNRQFDGLKFVRQTPIGPFFADFLCRELKLVVEIDGGTHSTDEEIENDARRSAYLQATATLSSARTIPRSTRTSTASSTP